MTHLGAVLAGVDTLGVRVLDMLQEIMFDGEDLGAHGAQVRRAVSALLVLQPLVYLLLSTLLKYINVRLS